MKRSLCLAAVGLAVLVCLPAQAKVLVYEPFAYPDGWLNGNGGALGTTGVWQTYDAGEPQGWWCHPEGEVTGQGDDLFPGGGTVLNLFDGTVDNLPTFGGFAGPAGPTDQSTPGTWGARDATGNLDANIGLDPSVTATFQSGTTTWFSYVGAHADNRNQGSPTFMLCTDPTVNGARSLTMQNSGNGIGGVGGPPRSNLFQVYPHYFSGGVHRQTPGGYLGGVLGGHNGIVTAFCSTATCDGVLGADATKDWVLRDAGGYMGVPNIVVGKIEWDADTNGEDVISVVSFLETDELTEAAFNAIIAAKPLLSSRNWPGNKPNLDQSQFDTINISSLKFYIDEIRIGTRFEDMLGEDPTKASGPEPETEGVDVPCDVVLAWTAGKYAATHDVYFGSVFDDVNEATTASAVYKGRQDGTTFAPSRLEFDTIYYWRIDEVNAPPDSTIYKGDVWSFTTEPVAYLITNVQATASSSSNTETEPANLVNESGLTLAADGQWVHGIDDKTMWQSAPSGLPATVVFEFDHTYKLHEMKVWNHNTSNEGLFGIGAKEVTIEVADSNEGPWTAVADTTLTRAPGLPDTPATDTIPMLGVMARSVRLTIRSSQGGVAAAGLAEVQFFYIPVAPRELSPADGTALTAPEATLAWRSGREAAEHRVYLATEDKRALVEGSDPTALAATVPAQGPYASYAPMGLNLSQTYLWKITEVNVAEIPATHDSAILSFTTPEYLPVDDFESYKNEAFKEIWATWLDGTEFGTKDPTNGSIVGLDPAAGDYNAAPGRNGGQSLPVWFTNTAAAPKSEVIRTSPFGDWTAHGIKSLSLWFYGDPANSGGRLYVKINNSAPIFCDGDPTDLAKAIWQPFNIDLSKVGGGVSNVTKLAVGVEGVGANGIVRIDDIRLYPKTVDLVTPAAPDPAGLVAHYRLDGDGKDATGKHDGTLVNMPAFAPGKYGDALSVTLDQYVNVPYAADLSLNTFTVAAWVNVSDLTGARGIVGTRFNGDNTFDLKVDATRVHGDIGNGTNWLSTAIDVPTILSTGEWYHICYVLDDAADTVQMYVNGLRARTMVVPGTFLFMKAGQDLRIGTDYPTEPFRGMIDDVRLYNRPLSPAEVAGLADRTTPIYVPFE